MCTQTSCDDIFIFIFFFFAPVLASQTDKDGKFKPCYPGNFSVSVQ